MKKIGLLFIVFISLINCSTNRNEAETIYKLNLSEHDILMPVKMKLGKTVLVSWEENPSTGYRIEVTSPTDCVVEIDEGHFEPMKTVVDLVGAPGLRTYSIRANAIGECQLVFSKIAPGENRPSESKVLEIMVE